MSVHGLKIGYKISNSNDARTEAQDKASMLIKHAEKSVCDLKLWADGLTKESKEILAPLRARIRWQRQDFIDKSLEKELCRATRLETDFSNRLRSFCLEMSNLMSELSELNPPLASKELDPYLAAILESRRQGMTALEPLSKLIHGFSQLKSFFSLDLPNLTQNRPAA